MPTAGPAQGEVGSTTERPAHQEATQEIPEHQEPTQKAPGHQEPTQETPEHQEPTEEAPGHQEATQESPVHQVTSRQAEASCKPEEDSSVCESAAYGGETPLLGTAGSTLEEKAAQETDVLPAEATKTQEHVTKRPQEKEDLDQGESLPTLGPDNLGLGLEETGQEKELLVLGLKETKRRSVNFVAHSCTGP